MIITKLCANPRADTKALLSKHLPELSAPTFQFLIARQSHHDDLIILDVFLELVIGFGMKDVLALAAENALRFGADEKIGE